MAFMEAAFQLSTVSSMLLSSAPSSLEGFTYRGMESENALLSISSIAA